MLLLKLGERDHMEQFRRGSLYMNPLSYFRSLEADSARGDRYEGTTHIFQPEDVIMKLSVPGFGEIVIDVKDLAGPTTLATHREQCCNIFCMHAITEPINGPIFPSEHQWFGDSMVLVLNTQDFLDRVEGAAKARRLSGAGKLVEYFDPNSYTGPLNRFRKSREFAHQREYRIALNGAGTDTLRLDIGDITDITSEVLPFCDSEKVLKFTEQDARDASLTW